MLLGPSRTALRRAAVRPAPHTPLGCPGARKTAHSRSEQPRRRHTAAAAAQEMDTVDAGGSDAPEDDRLPVTVVTGFLGSGKTTLINHILTQPHGRKVAIVENEFGEVGIDNDLIVGKEDLQGDEVTILENGCICCTVRDDLVKALQGLVARGGFDQVLIETTGVANPAPIITTLLLEPNLQRSVRMDGICTVVDAKHISAHLDRKEETGQENEACAQLAYADRIVLNKTDLVDAAALRDIKGRVAAINGLASLQEAQQSIVPVDYVLGIGGYALSEISTQVERELQELEEEAAAHSHDHSHDCDDPGCTDPSHDHGHAHSHDHGHAQSHDHGHDHGHSHAHSHDHGHDHAHGEGHAHVHHKNIHDDGVTSASFVIEGAMDLAKLNLWLGALLDLRGDDIYRMKGILNIKYNKERFVFQGVHKMFEGCPDREWRDDEKRISKLVFIGRELDSDLLKEGFEDCLWVDQGAAQALDAVAA